jgi:hypothetical protein
MIETIIYQFHCLDVEILQLLKAGYKTGIQAVYFSGVGLQQSQIMGTDPNGTDLRLERLRSAACGSFLPCSVRIKHAFAR